MIRKPPFVRASLIVAGAAALALVAGAWFQPDTAEAQYRDSRLAQCRQKARASSQRLQRVEHELALYKERYGELDDRRRSHRRARKRPARRGPAPMSRYAFAQFQQQFEDASFKSRRVRLVERALRTSYFTTAQLVTLLRECSFDSARVEIAAMAYPRIVDRENWIQVYGAFTFQSSGRRLDRKLGLDR